MGQREDIYLGICIKSHRKIYVMNKKKIKAKINFYILIFRLFVKKLDVVRPNEDLTLLI